MHVPLDKNKFGKNSVGADITPLAKRVGWSYQTTMGWNEQNISTRTAWGSWLSASAPYVIAPAELIIVLDKNTWKKAHKGACELTKQAFMQWTNGVWTFSGESAKRLKHPAPLPRKLPKRCIKLFLFIGDTVLAPLVGSGTTLIAAIHPNRYAYGLDIAPTYIELAQARIQRECL